MIIINFYKRITILVIITFSTVILLSGCGSETIDENLNTTKSLNVLVTDEKGNGIPEILVELNDDQQIYSEFTNSSGLISFDNLSLSENEIYTVTAKDYISKTENFDLSTVDNNISPIEIKFDSVILAYFDEFSDLNSGWQITDNDDFRSEYVDNKYEIELKKHPIGRAAQNPGILNGITDFVVSADMELLSGVGNYGFEIAWNNYNNYVYIGIVKKNDLKILWVRENGNNVLQKDISSYLNKKDINNLKMVQEGFDTTIYLDDELIETVILSQTLPAEASLTLNVNTEASDALPIVSFDNFRLLELI